MLRVIRILTREDLQKETRQRIGYPLFPPEVLEAVNRIIRDVSVRGDEALIQLTEQLDGVQLSRLAISSEEIAHMAAQVSDEVRAAITESRTRLERIARRQLAQLTQWEEVVDGARICQHVIPLERVGIYVPGGRYPLVSSLLMAGVPARIAGVSEIIVCTPPGKGKEPLHPAIAYVLQELGITRVYRIGGAQAIAAMALGTESIPAVDKVVGPGNVYVAAAKYLLSGIVGIDLLAGPTEVVVVAEDGVASPEWIAADLLAQAEHDVHAQPILVSLSEKLVMQVQEAVHDLLPRLGENAAVARRALEANGKAYLVSDRELAIELVNWLAPEHLELMVVDPEDWLPHLRNWGALFIGGFACEVLGDYSSGMNHILPTNRTARFASGMNPLHFVRVCTSLAVSTREVFLRLAESAETLACVEGLRGHAEAVRVRR